MSRRGSFPVKRAAGSRRSKVRYFSWLLFSCVVSFQLAGCALSNRAIDTAGDAAGDVYANACKTPANRKLAVAVLLNGMLIEQGGVVLVCCPGDKRAVCSAARKYYTDLFKRAGA